MNKLEEVIIDHYHRISSANGERLDLLEEAQGEILEVASPELTLQIILGSRQNDAARLIIQNQIHRKNKPKPFVTTATSKDLVLTECSDVVGDALKNARWGVLKSGQGYIGGIIIEKSGVVIYGNNIIEDKLPNNGINSDDEFQRALRDDVPFYPPTIWAKALRAVAYLNRPESAESLTIEQYLTDLGLSLGSFAVSDKLFLGASGFMLGEKMQGTWDDPVIDEYIDSEPRVPIRLSGLCDQIAVNSRIIEPILNPTTFVHGAIEGSHIRDIVLDVIKNGGTLN